MQHPTSPVAPVAFSLLSPNASSGSNLERCRSGDGGGDESTGRQIALLGGRRHDTGIAAEVGVQVGLAQRFLVDLSLIHI